MDEDFVSLKGRVRICSFKENHIATFVLQICLQNVLVEWKTAAAKLIFSKNTFF